MNTQKTTRIRLDLLYRLEVSAKILAIMTAALLLFALVAVSGTASASSKVLTVEGQNDTDVDRENIQIALDAAKPEDTVRLRGHFKLDGFPLEIRKSGITLEGLALDNDGDGLINEDWADGIDNDGDGLIDEDGWNAVLEGVVDPDGNPASDLFANSLFNRPVRIQGGSGNLRDISIRDLEFTSFDSGITLLIGVEASQGHMCGGMSLTGETMSHVAITGNRFDNLLNRAVSIAGPLQHFLIQDNITHIESIESPTWDILMQPGLLCFNPDGTTQQITLGAPIQGRIMGNMFTGGGSNGISGAIAVSLSESIEVRDNKVQDKGRGFLVAGGTGIEVSRNDIANTMLGVIGLYPSTNNRVANNNISDTTYGILLDFAASGYDVVNNDIQESPGAGIALTGFPVDDQLLVVSNNRIVSTDFTTTLFLAATPPVSPDDIAAVNDFVGTFAMIYNPGVPDEVRETLETLRTELGARVP